MNQLVFILFLFLPNLCIANGQDANQSESILNLISRETLDISSNSIIQKIVIPKNAAPLLKTISSEPYEGLISEIKTKYKITPEQNLINHANLIGQFADLKDESIICQKIAKHSVGQISKSDWLEKLLFIEMLSCLKGKSPEKAEFAALVKESDSHFVVYMNCPTIASDVGGTSLNFSKYVDDIENSVLIHNHPFNFSNPYGDIGGLLAPSSPDLKYFKDITDTNIKFVITNGLESVLLTKSDIEILHKN